MEWGHIIYHVIKSGMESYSGDRRRDRETEIVKQLQNAHLTSTSPSVVCYPHYDDDLESYLRRLCETLVIKDQASLWRQCDDTSCPCQGKISTQDLMAKHGILRLVNALPKGAVYVFMLDCYPSGRYDQSKQISMVLHGTTEQYILPDNRSNELYVHARTTSNYDKQLDEGRTWGSEKLFTVSWKYSHVWIDASKPPKRGDWIDRLYNNPPNEIAVYGDRIPYVPKGTVHTITYK
jgi:hypothetical protein